MNLERWQDLISKLEEEGKIESRETVDLEDRPGTVEYVLVGTPLGAIRLSWTTEFKKLEEKALYSKRGGSTMHVQAKYDETEELHYFMVERQDESGEWQEFSAADLAL